MLWSELLLLIEPFLLGMFLYVAIVAKDPTLFIYAGAVFTFITWLAIFSDEHLKFRTRIKLLLISPYMYITSFIMAAVQVTAALRSILGLRGIFGTKELSGAYTTTQRAPKGQGITS